MVFIRAEKLGLQPKELSEEDKKYQEYVQNKVAKMKAQMQVSEKELDEKNVPLHLRDACVRHVMQLNDCRHETYYAPWKCEEERVRYERCQYKQYVKKFLLIVARHLKNVKRSEELWKREQKLRLVFQQIDAKEKQ